VSPVTYKQEFLYPRRRKSYIAYVYLAHGTANMTTEICTEARAWTKYYSSQLGDDSNGFECTLSKHSLQEVA
jgi:hypothetical protein